MSLALLLSALLCAAAGRAEAAAYGQQQQQQQSQSSQSFDATSSRRDRNLDHWDAATLAAYLGLAPDGTPLPHAPPKATDPTSSDPIQIDTYAGHDAVILFYAQWCPNCHSLAPTYDAIGTHLKAGSTKSNLIMALFDCERDQQHMKLCAAAGVKHYPTVMFVGSGPYHDTDPITSRVVGRDKSAGPAGATPPALRRAVKFQGDYRYGEQLLDWIRTMRSLSRWHRLNTEGFLSVVRRSLFGLFRKSGGAGRVSSESLPVGVPPKLLAASAAVGGGAVGAGSADLQRQVSTLEAKVKQYEKNTEDINKAILHASYVVDAMLFPAPLKEGSAAVASSSKSEPPYPDAFATLTSTGGWEAKPPPAEAATADASASATDSDAAAAAKQQLDGSYLLKTCVVDLCLDYCTRVATKVTTSYLDELTAMPDSEYPSLTELDSLLNVRTEAAEPYCAKFDACYAADFAGEGCRPEVCPFKNDVACRYVAGCFNDSIEGEYRDALTKKAGDDDGKGAAAAAAAAAGAGASSGGGTAGKGAWGFA